MDIIELINKLRILEIRWFVLNETFFGALMFRVRPISPARVSSLPLTEGEEEESGDVQTRQQQVNSDVLSVLTGKPIMALAFENMVMSVDAPTVVVAEPATVSEGKHGHGLLGRFPRSRAPVIPTSPA